MQNHLELPQGVEMTKYGMHIDPENVVIIVYSLGAQIRLWINVHIISTYPIDFVA